MTSAALPSGRETKSVLCENDEGRGGAAACATVGRNLEKYLKKN
jgi:hypothetical protein